MKGDVRYMDELIEEVKTDDTGTKDRRNLIAKKRNDEINRAKHNEERESRRMNWMQLNSAMHERRALSSKIISVETLNDEVVVCTVMYYGYRIIIPCSEMYEKSPIDISTVHTDAERIRREKQMLSKLLTAEISFIITKIDGNPEGDNYAIVASRKEAITRQAARNFNKRGKDSKPLISEGDIVDAAIVSVGRHAVWANVQGKDVSIPIYLLTYRYVSDATQMYRPGDILPVYIMHVDYDDEGHAVGLAVSGREPEIEKYKQRLRHISSGSTYLGRITSIRRSSTDNSRTIVTLFLEGIEVPAISSYLKMDSMANPPMTGDSVVFSAYRTDEERGIVVGSIIRRC